ncbi:24189_t:CDS:2 [Gigaspora margarita]|uniref:24189_t:CDS:1 n=1 Tax=Gigaspora margarita TaxID=4874 RepID=A0ABN7UNF1_GIGMA|nr:24189_t:CDS:2 [Gigaspora margarita]
MTNSITLSIKYKRISNLTKKCNKCGFRRRHKDTNSLHCVYCDLSSKIPQSGSELVDNFVKNTFIAPGASNKVVLKCLKNSKHITSNFLNELEIYNKCIKSARYDDEHLIKYSGITKDPKTEDFIIIMEFIENGDLHHFLLKNINSLTWLKRLEMLKGIAHGLAKIHRKQIIHRDFHSGNILINNNHEVAISDFGISMSENESLDDNEIYGVIPYIAPEVLKGGKFTAASDVYSLGMIIWELTCGCRPFSDRIHDEYLILDILDGLRPKIIYNTPQLFIDLMEMCWDADQFKRPATEKLMSDINYALNENKYKFSEIPCINLIQNHNPRAIYTSRPMSSLIKIAQRMQSNSLNNIIFGMKIKNTSFKLIKSSITYKLSILTETSYLTGPINIINNDYVSREIFLNIMNQ